MKVTREQVVELLQHQGDEGTAQQASSELPAEIDTDSDRALLDKYGIDLADLTGGDAGLEDVKEDDLGGRRAGLAADEGPGNEPPQGGHAGTATSSMP